jgi:arsenate reductase
MAAGWLRHLGGDRIEVLSAGSKPGKAVAARAVAVMGEVGIDISGNTPRHYSEYLTRSIDYAIAVCQETDESCFTGFSSAAKFLSLPVEDPGDHGGTEEEILEAHRKVRDELQVKMSKFLSELLP